MSTHASSQNLSRACCQTSDPNGAGLLLRKKCACGGTVSSLDSECEECRKKRLQSQSRLAVGASNDPLEADADRAADEVMSEPEGASPPQVQRHAASASAGAGIAPPSVDHALAAAGQPLEPALRTDMEKRFGHDFARVRVHSGGAAERSARDVSADAYTVGHDIVFGAGQLPSTTRQGRRLLAHELAHVVQQGNGAPVLRAQPKKKKGPGKTAKKAPAAKPAKPPQICGRDSRKVKDNWITKVNLDVGTNELTIEWDDPKTAPALSKGTHAISPGTGKCCLDCNDDTTSQTAGSLCTPKGGTWKVFDTGCHLPGHTGAKNPSYFQRATIAIHSGNTSSPPQSHGCSRTAIDISELIHDNVVKDKTDVAVSGTWAGTKCYMKESDETPVNRKDVCDGNKLKSTEKKKEKKEVKGEKKETKEKKKEPKEREVKPKAGGGIPSEKGKPVAAADELAGSDDLTAMTELEPPEPVAGEIGAAAATDGPGPHNEPASREGSDEATLADVDLDESEDESGGEAANA
jgi:hypothetical protein